MRITALVAVLVAAFMANSASAGFIPIDNFDGTPAGMQGTRTSVTTGGGSVSFSTPGQVDLFSFDVGTARIDYTGMNNIFLGGFNSIRLVGSGAGSGTISVAVNGGAFATPQSVLGSGYVFDFGPGDLTLTSLSILLEKTTAGGFAAVTLTSVQAVPEPTTLALLGLVSAGGGVAGWRRRKVVAAV